MEKNHKVLLHHIIYYILMLHQIKILDFSFYYNQQTSSNNLHAVSCDRINKMKISVVLWL